MLMGKPNVVILTGAGISKESGLSTFRDRDGIWANVDINDVATPDAYHNNPTAVYSFHDSIRRKVLSDDVQPNAAHFALAKLEDAWAENVLIVTQNIDNLHERAGTENVIHMHGEILKARCPECGSTRSCWADLDANDLCSSCEMEAVLRPHVVWFGESPLEMLRIYAALDECETFISIGTSSSVYPAAEFISLVKARQNVRTIEINLERSEKTDEFSESHLGLASEIVPRIVEEMLVDGP
jgi:NAD-dependent deacetylase